jgi:hypothetical protein
MRRSQRASIQAFSPRSWSAAGRRTPRTIVAASRTAVARPTPSCFMSIVESVAKMPNAPTMTTAALVTTPAVRSTPLAIASLADATARRAPRIRERTNT